MFKNPLRGCLPYHVFVAAVWPNADWFPVPRLRCGPLGPTWAADLVVKGTVTSVPVAAAFTVQKELASGVNNILK